ncbi:MAG: hypothetical protein R3B90_09565 [Planctomycetaceae bacterium]
MLAGRWPVRLHRRRPAAPQPEYIHPAILEFGKVVHLPDAAQQPRPDSRIVVDLTQGGEPGKLNAGLEKVCRFVNIYAGAGARPARVDIVVVLHGDATLIALSDEAYATRFQTAANPSLTCLRELRKAG